MLLLFLLLLIADLLAAWGQVRVKDGAGNHASLSLTQSDSSLEDELYSPLMPHPKTFQFLHYSVQPEKNFRTSDIPRKLSIRNWEGDQDNNEQETSVLHDDRLKKNIGKDKGNGQRFRYNPSISMIGLGKRNQRNRPKYNPGWKLIGLGKRKPFESMGLMEMERRDIRVRTLKDFNPYFGLLALNNLSSYFTELKKELAHDSPSLGSEIIEEDSYSEAPENTVISDDKEPTIQNGGSSLFMRSRKPNRGFKSRDRHVYDPAWRLTGLGK